MSSRSPHPQNRIPESAHSRADKRSLEGRWDALLRKADQIAALAELASEPNPEQSGLLLVETIQMDSRTFAIIEKGIEDMEMLVSIGLKALNEVSSRDQSTMAPALSLWREFYHARQSVLAVLEPVPT